MRTNGVTPPNGGNGGGNGEGILVEKEVTTKLTLAIMDLMDSACEALEALLDMVNQYCRDAEGKLTEPCLSADELAIYVLRKEGLVKDVEGGFELDWTRMEVLRGDVQRLRDEVKKTWIL